MVSMGKEIPKEEAKNLVLNALNTGDAYAKFLQLVESQRGNVEKVKICDHKKYIKAKKRGTITDINALELGKLSVSLGAGRKSKEDKIDYTVGIKLNKLVGDEVKKGDILAYIYTNNSIREINSDEIFTIK